MPPPRFPATKSVPPRRQEGVVRRWPLVPSSFGAGRARPSLWLVGQQLSKRELASGVACAQVEGFEVTVFEQDGAGAGGDLDAAEVFAFEVVEGEADARREIAAEAVEQDAGDV